jgi:hypothetical protein
MFNKNTLILLFMIAIVLFSSACASKISDSKQAQQVLTDFFNELSAGDYMTAAQLYGGSYEILIRTNSGIDPEDYANLWQRACQDKNIMCLIIRTVTFNELTATGEYIFTVEFNNPDGSLFVLQACCGENPTTPPQFQFEYRVVEGGDGKFRVLDMPVNVL